MKQLLYLISGFFCLTVSCQEPAIVPKNGKMIFVQERHIVSEQQLDSSLNQNIPFLTEMMGDLLFQIASESEEEMDSSRIDQILKSKIEPGLRLSLDPRGVILPPQKYTYHFQDSIIKSKVQTSPLKDSNEVTFINRADGSLDLYILRDTTLVLDNTRMAFRQKENYKEIAIQEYRDIKKKIFGYECFKIVVTTKESILEKLGMLSIEPSPEFLSKYADSDLFITEQEMYVTEQIQCKYHPVLNLSKVLDNYYPLEIIKRESLLDGVENTVTVKEININ